MKILIMNRIPYQKIEYHRGLDHFKHEVTYIGTEKFQKQIPSDLRCKKITIPGERAVEFEVLERVSVKDRFRRVISLSEFEIFSAARVRVALGIPGARPSTVLKVRDKIEMKKNVYRKKIRIPHYFSAEKAVQMEASDFPWKGKTVLKPTQGASSEGVEVFSQLQNALDSLKEKRSLEGLEIEEFIEGEIYHADGLIQDGKLQHFVLSRYVGSCFDYLKGFPVGSHQIDCTEGLKKWIKSCLEAVEIENGAFHLEFIQDIGEEPVFLEIANRVGGGDVIRSFEEKTGIHVPSAELQILVHQKGADIPEFKKFKKKSKLYGWFVFPGHQFQGKKVDTQIPGWIKEHPQVLSIKRLPDGADHPSQVTYQDWEVPVAGFVTGNHWLEIRQLLCRCMNEIQVGGIK